MTPRSNKYFRTKMIIKHIHYAFDLAEQMIKRSQPIPLYPEGNHRSGIAIVSSDNLELAALPGGGFIIPKHPTNPGVVSQGMIDVIIERAFTPFAKTNTKPVE